MTRRPIVAAAIVLQCLIEAGSAAAQPRPAAPGTTQPVQGQPPRALLRQDEDWSAIPAAERPSAKGVAVAPGLELTVAADAYLKWQYYDDQSFGDFPGVDDALNTRANIHLTATAGRLRVHGALKHGGVLGSRLPVPPVERDDVDLHQAFAEVAVGDVLGLRRSDVLLRLGRQELHYGAGRLVSIREGPNVRADYDGGLVRVRTANWVGDAFLFWPTRSQPGAFDNDQPGRDPVGGLYASGPVGTRLNLDAYYVGFRRSRSRYAYLATAADERRHSLGLRLWSGEPEGPGWGGELEAGLQFGEARTPSDIHDVLAWQVAGQIGYRFDAPLSPAPGLYFGVTSGDGDRDDRRLGTFRAPAPTGNLFGETNPFGPGNLVGVRPFLDLQPVEGLTLTGQVQLFWRVSAQDGLYDVAQEPLRGAVGREHFVGYEPALVASLDLGRGWTVSGKAGRFETGAYLRTTRPDRDVTNFELKLTTRY